MWCGHDGWGWGGWRAMSLMAVVVLAVVIWAAVAVTRANVTGVPTRGRAPEEILAECLASGEIDDDDYQRRLDVLHGRKRSQAHKTDTP